MSARPNILLIMTDQQRADAMGCSGGWVDTPTMDRIAQEGVRFSNAVTNSPVCVPARLSMATGLYPHNTGVWENCSNTMDPNTSTWMQALQKLGYRTSLFGKTHLHPHEGDLRDREGLMNVYGLDHVDEIGGPRASMCLMSHMTARWQDKGLLQDYQEDFKERFSNIAHVVRESTLPLEEYADTYVGQQAASYLSAYEEENPWFCWVSFSGPHEPWDTPLPWSILFDSADMPRAIPRSDLNMADRPQGQLDQRLQEEEFLTLGDIAAMRSNYAGNVALIDAQIGCLMEILEQRGELENTIIAFTSDHGELNGDHGLIYKSCFLDGCVRVPFLVRTPATLRAAGTQRVCASPTEWMDMGPTLVELAGGSLEYTQFGKSVVDCLNDQGVHHRTEAISQINHETMLLDERWKCVLNAEGEVYLLFDVCQDKGEQNNLAGQEEVREIELKLKRSILERIAETQL